MSEKNCLINYDQIVKEHHWIVEKNQDCIISSDSDGLLCGLFMSNVLGWKIRGFYDGKVMLLDKDVDVVNCIFLDMEIFRKNIRSVGHHMVQFNKNKRPTNWDNFSNCIQPNNLRNFDGYKDFRSKYPLATIHFLIGIIGSRKKISVPKSAICPLLYTDGVFKNLFGYPENCIDWLKYLSAESDRSVLHNIFFNDHYTVYNLMVALKDFFIQISQISENKKGNDKIKISNSKCDPVNITKDGSVYELAADEKKKVERFLNILSELTSWDYKTNNWKWGNYTLYQFNKSSVAPNNRNYEAMISKNPLSWAMTSGLAIEYTLDTNSLLE